MEGLTQGIYNIIEWALSLLPDSPFAFLVDLTNGPQREWLKWLNWFIPINTFASILQAWVTAILTYYVIQIVMRWVKAIE